MTKDYGRNPHLFIVGCQRSGRTLLQRVVDADPDVAITYEADWIVRHLKGRIGPTLRSLIEQYELMEVRP